MGIVETFGHAMIQAFLEDSELHYLRDRDGDFVVEFGYDEEVLGHPRFMLVASGDDHEQYCLRGDTMKRIPKAEWDRLIRLCNEWNAQYKLPKVYLEIDDPNASRHRPGRLRAVDQPRGRRPPGADQPDDQHLLLRLLRLLALARTAGRPPRPRRRRLARRGVRRGIGVLERFALGWPTTEQDGDRTDLKSRAQASPSPGGLRRPVAYRKKSKSPANLYEASM